MRGNSQDFKNTSNKTMDGPSCGKISTFHRRDTNLRCTKFYPRKVGQGLILRLCLSKVFVILKKRMINITDSNIHDNS